MGEIYCGLRARLGFFSLYLIAEVENNDDDEIKMSVWIKWNFATYTKEFLTSWKCQALNLKLISSLITRWHFIWNLREFIRILNTCVKVNAMIIHWVYIKVRKGERKTKRGVTYKKVCLYLFRWNHEIFITDCGLCWGVKNSGYFRNISENFKKWIPVKTQVFSLEMFSKNYFLKLEVNS